MKSYILPALIAFALQMVVCPVLIPLLHKLKFGQYIREEGPAAHQKKAGTPTMGGIAILLTFTIAALFFLKGNKGTIPLILLTWGMGLIGMADDLLKIVFKNNDGLKAWQKFGMQILVAIAFVIYLGVSGVGTKIQMPWSDKMLDLHFLYYILAVLLIVGFDNGSNFTDGLDGLLTSVTSVIVTFLAIAALGEGGKITPACSAMLGALLGFLVFNTNPAKVFMGDTGSLALGGFVTGAALLLKIPILVFVICFIYLAEVCSVIIQVLYFKKTGGKRFFRMAPIHHHFELGGWKETKVVTIFTIVTALLCLVALWML
ncbi:MAG: phospho-N-acetylmuramoyl-pentapeptide-transferase [Clostridiales bacterium]|nr:phospho-N-acetylmuramoyl-pentapeptide-transferase [Clostridiales bacterium]